MLFCNQAGIHNDVKFELHPECVWFDPVRLLGFLWHVFAFHGDAEVILFSQRAMTYVSFSIYKITALKMLLKAHLNQSL
jgi:hypothetical protein